MFFPVNPFSAVFISHAATDLVVVVIIVVIIVIDIVVVILRNQLLKFANYF